MIRSLEELVVKAKLRKKLFISVAGAEDSTVLMAVSAAKNYGFIEGFLVGNPPEIKKIARENNIDIQGFEIIKALTPEEKVKQAVSLVVSNKADIPMKGNVHSSIFLKAVLDKEYGLRTLKLFSHVGIFQVPTLSRLLIITDAAMNITPTLKEKVEIINNALEVARVLEIETPKVAVLAAVETVSENMPATMEAAILTQMNKRGQIKGCLIDGPLALDGAISREAALHKGITSMVAGEADILLVPDIEAGNVLYKALIYVAGGETAGVILGGKRPLVLTSRTDSLASKIYSIALTVLLSTGGGND
ncbi:MAG: Phosphate acetyltransferase [candidate division WS2 bacterium]|uniref:Phosphate acetyltransferase n=1 Tax=Psychracetigena formicireducens TaxID=2986056 RepID=A0A9E2BEV9_PSYF1|nr:Phosphate acetyltransferase [Candidatus Psychracetigena formicireducens]